MRIESKQDYNNSARTIFLHTRNRNRGLEFAVNRQREKLRRKTSEKQSRGWKMKVRTESVEERAKKASEEMKDVFMPELSE